MKSWSRKSTSVHRCRILMVSVGHAEPVAFAVIRRSIEPLLKSARGVGDRHVKCDRARARHVLLELLQGIKRGLEHCRHKRFAHREREP